MNARWIPFAVVAVLVLFGSFIAPDYYTKLFAYIGLYSIVALGLVLLTGVGGMTSFGQAAFVGLGAYTTAALTVHAGLSPWWGLVGALVITAAAALALGYITMRLSGHYLPLCTIAWGTSLYYLFGNIQTLGGHTGLQGIPPIRILSFTFDDARSYFYLIWVVTLLSLIAVQNLLDSRSGRAIKALKGASVMAEAFGVNTASLKIRIFVYAAVLACISGWLYAHLLRFINPTPFGLHFGVEFLFMAVVGGAGSVWGAVIGATVITLLKHWLQDWLPGLTGHSANYEVTVFGALMILLLHRARGGMTSLKVSWLQAPKRAVMKAVEPLRPVAHNKTASTKLLKVKKVRKQFGGLVAVKDLSFEVGGKEIVGLIGPNGAGKSTMFNLITGVHRATSGEVYFRGERIDGLASRDIARRGIARTFQHVNLVPDMTVLENVALGTYLRADAGMIRASCRLDRNEEAAAFAEAERQLQRTGLTEYRDVAAGNLALGPQRIVEIARALCVSPALLLLDEPAAGLRLQERQRLAALLRQLREEGMSVLLVEHDMDFVMQLADRIVVMEFGQHLAEGRPDEIQSNPAVLEAYLGGI
jgi:branched-chain amino acid transport system permease protein